MNQHLQHILTTIQQDKHLSPEEKNAIIKSLKDADKEFAITSFKLDRTEKVKRTTAILLEETIEELEQKRKAVEAQNKELEIESSLERVRTVAMSMNKADDMLEVCKTISHQLNLLAVKEIRNVQTAIFYKEKGTYMNYEYYAKHDKTFITETSYTNSEMHTAFAAQMLKGAGESFATHMNGDEVKDWIAHQKTTNVFIDDYLNTASSLNYYWHSLGPVALGISTYEPLKEEEKNLFRRFVKVFELAYRRYLDIEKAATQAKEAQVELALERVRARTMAMQHSDEMAETASVLFQQIKELGFETWSCGFCIWTNNEMAEVWMGADSGGLLPPMLIPYKEEPTHRKIYEASLADEPEHNKVWEREELQEHYKFLKTIPSVKEAIDILEQSGLSLPVRQCYYVGFFEQGYLLVITKEPNDELKELSKRFGKVFEQTYTRFLDLQKAEAQARESQIEAALERVRSRSMAMQKSEELEEVIQVVYDQYVQLNIKVEHTGFIMDYKERDDMFIWLADKHAVPFQIAIPYFDSPHWNSFIEAKATGKDFFTNHLSFEEKNKFYHDLFKLFPVPDEAKEYYFSCPGLAISTVLLDNVGLYIENFSGVPYSDDENKTLMRFGKVFEQTYTRFLDLQKAEAQARESQVQLALERVRAKTMAMQHSDELADTTAILFNQFKNLGYEPERITIGIMQEEKQLLNLWATDGKTDEPKEFYQLPFNEPHVLSKCVKAWKEHKKSLVLDLHGQPLKEYAEFWRSFVATQDARSTVSQVIFNFAFFSKGYLGFISFEHVQPQTIELLERFASVFDLTYTRFLDLQKAETQAKEARIETALERVRSRTLAMQKSDELVDTSAVLFKQLISLGISPNRLYISIVKNDIGDTEFWITDEDGSKVSMAYEDNLNNNPSFKKMFDGWKQQKKSLVIDMKGEELSEYFNYLDSIHVPFKSGFAQKRRLQYIAYFSKGFIGMASPEDQPADTLQLLERFAYVLNLTFTRFNDLQLSEAHAVQAEEDLVKLQTEKRRAEDALTELKETQNQLVQSEKMASLGELTAGIAHEIQNPLNFVNNFSEVSKELLDEMKLALESGNKEEADEIANDIIQNLEKINHHGKRADAIVKGMLQHSRQTSGTKEPTDINALCDEYVRLCYHGLRAKDSSFNVTIKTDFDTTIEKINIIPQDISRVILNVLTNAFYAVSKPPAPKGEQYKPFVSVTTRKLNSPLGVGGVEIIVRDNGNGIPQNIIDKIFQPFFTTKPTGQGTGLGLSLAYDTITKQHNGTIKVESKEGEGTTFIIQLPDNKN